MTVNVFQDPFYGARAPRGPARNAFAITPADDAPLPCPTSAIYVGTGGTLAVYLAGDQILQAAQEGGATAPVVFLNVPAGTYLPISVSCVMATGTTAANIIGLV